LPKNDRLVHQLTSLERTVTKGSGRDVIDHPRDMHDDLANCCAGAATVAKGKYRYQSDLSWVYEDNDAAAAAERFEQNRASQHVLVHAGYYRQNGYRRF
jgi:hypothetical protein